MWNYVGAGMKRDKQSRALVRQIASYVETAHKCGMHDRAAGKEVVSEVSILEGANDPALTAAVLRLVYLAYSTGYGSVDRKGGGPPGPV